MRPNPFDDVVHFLIQPVWFTPVFWLLLLASVIIAIRVWRGEPAQRSVHALGLWVLRVLVGSMWWQQTLWKIPPNFDGLRYWMEQEAAHASVALQSAFVSDLVLPNLAVLARWSTWSSSSLACLCCWVCLPGPALLLAR
jgi:hypothetical protein